MKWKEQFRNEITQFRIMLTSFVKVTLNKSNLRRHFKEKALFKSHLKCLFFKKRFLYLAV